MFVYLFIHAIIHFLHDSQVLIFDRSDPYMWRGSNEDGAVSLRNNDNWIVYLVFQGYLCVAYLSVLF